MSTKSNELFEKNRILLDEIADKWTILVLCSLCDGPLRFNELKRRVAGISQKTLTECLRRLERNGILSRRIIDSDRLGVEYEITSLGLTLDAPLQAMAKWVDDFLLKVVKCQKEYDSRKMAHVII